MSTRQYNDLSKEELVRLLEARDRQAATRFGLVWEADEIERERALNSDFVALDLVPDESCGDAPWRNLIIEGDNFDALRFLRMGFAGRVKCIYIDPPYNTGNRDFVYNDRFVDKEDAWRHSKWCEFMYQRLMIARDVLREDGAIFVSIDDNELFALGLLMTRVFGENNFVANIIWQKRYSAANDHKTIAPMHDFVVAFQASSQWRRNLLPRGAEKDRQYKFEDDRGVFRVSDYTCNKSAEERPNLFYAIRQPHTGEEVWPKRTRVWAYSQEEHERNVAENLVYWGKEGKGKVPSFKRYRNALRNADGVIPTTWWPHEEVGHNDTAKKELMKILSEYARAFSTPKPTGLIDRILQIATDPADLVLDFFAGSGTTAHAVLKRNAEDGGHRRFILVSNTEATEDDPEKNLCRDVCAKRVRRVIEGYGDTAGLAGDFAYLRCRRLPSERLTRIQHEQVWLALQMIHRDSMSPFKRGPFCWAGDEATALMYVPRFREEDVPAIRKQARQSGRVLLYSWEPTTFARHLSAKNIHLEPIPESLARRFGQKG